jgi:DNA-binding IscR family transcriptional regulator
MGDAEQLRGLIDEDEDHRALYEVFLAVRDAAAKILENTTVADLVARSHKKTGNVKAASATGKRR